MNSLTRLAQTASLAAIAFILMMIKTPIWLIPSFYKFDFSEIVSLIGGFALGPLCGICIVVLKNIIYLIIYGTRTGGIGEISNLLIGISLVFPSALYYKQHRNIYKSHHKGIQKAIIAMSIGLLFMVTTALILNKFLLIPVYAKSLHCSVRDIVNVAHSVNPFIKDIDLLLMFAVLPFNALKGIISCIGCFFLYKRVKPLIKKISP